MLYCFAKPIRQIEIDPIVRDAAWEARVSKSVLDSYASPAAHYVRIQGPITSTAKAQFSQRETKAVIVTDGAPRDVFRNGTFRGLERISLECKQNNDHLQNLAASYPGIKILVVSQAQPLNPASYKAIAKFKNLQALQLLCPTDTREILSNGLPESLVMLTVEGCNHIPPLPNLRRLDLHKCRINSSFLQTLKSPNLEVLYCDDIDVTKGSMARVDNLKQLRRLHMDNCSVDDSEVPHLRQNKDLHVTITRTADTQLFLSKAERYFRKNSFQQALRYYDASVFSSPSAYGYLQRSRCLIGLKRYSTAAESWRWAAAIDPTSSAVAELKRQLIQLGVLQ